jgi:glycosyltransferase involved in cell wall biosynthesis
MHKRVAFDAIMSFDLIGAGGIAWRIGRELRLPASGWAFGSDVRVLPSSAHGRVVARALQNLDLVFYQSRELLEKAASLLGIAPTELPINQHVVLPHGIPEPRQINERSLRHQKRSCLHITAGQIVVIYLGRIARQKGVLELLEACRLASMQDLRIRCVLVGSNPAFDDTGLLTKRLNELAWLRERVMIIPECSPDKVWEYLCAADIFAFPSHNEGMPNSLLEAMSIGLPAIAFAISAVQELENGTGGLVLVPQFEVKPFADAILRLAASPDERRRVGEKGRKVILERFMMDKNMAESLRRVRKLVNRDCS